MTGTGLGGKYNNELLDDIKSEHRRRRDDLRADVMADGYPPGHVPLDARRQLERMDRLRAQLDPRALSPEAHAEYGRLRRHADGGR